MKGQGIYIIQSKKFPERIYVGSATNIHNRWKQHRSNLLHNKHHSPALQHHYNKYGADDLVFDVIETGDYFDMTHIFAREQVWMDRCSFNDDKKPYFNVCSVAGSSKHRGNTDKSKEATRKTHKGKVVPEDVRKRISETLMGHPVSEETRKKLADAMKGHKLSEETKKKMGISLKGHPGSRKGQKVPHKTWAQTNARKKWISQYTLDGVFIRDWFGMSQVKKELTISDVCISKCCNGKRLSAGGFIWKFKEII